MKKSHKIILSFVLAVVLIVVIVIILTKSPTEKVPTNSKTTDKNLLIGNWIRTDASYLIKIIKVSEDRTLDVQYFNPNPINVGKASWQESPGNLKIIVELRDINYPGSTYTLNYIPDRDLLAGDYYQAVEGLSFYVEFTRNR